MSDPDFSPPTLTPAMVGRASQLAAAERLITAAGGARPGPRTLLVSGEAGIGKSRLLSALRERVPPGWAALESACFEPYQDEPYAPIVDMLGRHYPGPLAERVAGALATAAEALALLPGLARLAPRRAAADPDADIAQNQRRILRALADLFAGLAAGGPLLIVIEDIHWSDAATLVFLPILAHAIAGLPALLVVTYRADEIAPPLAAMLADLDRRRLASEIALPRLSRAEVESLLRGALGQERPVDPAFLDTLHELTDGNPFFVEEVVMALPPAAWAAGAAELPIPRSVHEAVARRSARLSPAARELITLAAALGRRFDFATLQHVTGRDEAELLARLRELIAARLIVEEADDQFAFYHALARAAVYGDLLARERRALHRRLGEALEPVLGEAHAADLARHFLLAGLWERALRYAEVAAGQARLINAQPEAVAHLTTALDAAAHLPATPLAPLLVARAEARNFIGDFEAAGADLDAAIADARARGRSEDEWSALISLGELWTARDYERAATHYARALQQARAIGSPALIARSLNRVGNWHMNQERPCTAEAMHAEALAIFEGLGDQLGQAESLELLGVSRFFAADVGGAMATLWRASAILRGHDDAFVSMRATARMALGCYASGEAVDADALKVGLASLEQMLQVVRPLGWLAYESAVLHIVGAHLLQMGELGRARASLLSSISISDEAQYYEWHAYALAWLSALSINLYDPAEAVAWSERARAAAGSISSATVAREVAHQLARAYTAAGDYAAAEAALARALRPAGEQSEPSLMLRRARLAGSELAMAQGAPGRALAEVDDLIATAINPAGKAIPTLWLARGEALAALGRRDEARQAIEGALATARAEGRRPLALRALSGLAGLAAAQRRREDAAALADQARALIDELAATLDTPDLRASFRRRALSSLPALPTVTPRQAVKQVFGGLTDRELDVARLIARGHTNRQIADALVLSERTVGAHVGSILSKLGFSSRIQVARWAVEKGIAR